MTIAINIKVNDGIIIAADSASTLIGKDEKGNSTVLKVFDNANKVFNLYKGMPIGAITFGAGSIGQASMDTLVKDFRRRISNNPPIPNHKAEIDCDNYSVEDLAKRFKKFIYDDRYVAAFKDYSEKPALGFVIAGYSTGKDLGEEYQILIDQAGKCHGPNLIRKAHESGVTWNGQPEALVRLFFGISNGLPKVLKKNGLTDAQIQKIIESVQTELQATLVWDPMPIKDAIELADFLVETAKKFHHFIPGAATVGGPTEIAAITKHEGFKWITRKHYYDREFNPTEVNPHDHTQGAHSSQLGDSPAKEPRGQ